MIIDTVSRLPLYECVIPGASGIASAFFASEPGSVPYEVREKAYALKEDSKRRFEIHFHTIDLMMACEGHEVIHVCPGECLTPAEQLPGGADGMKMDGEAQGTRVLLEQGYFCAIFPGEAHMVGGMLNGTAAGISKWVVKVPCPKEFSVEP